MTRRQSFGPGLLDWQPTSQSVKPLSFADLDHAAFDVLEMQFEEKRSANAGVYLHIHLDSLIRDNGERPRSSADMLANAVLHIQNIDARG